MKNPFKKEKYKVIKETEEEAKDRVEKSRKALEQRRKDNIANEREYLRSIGMIPDSVIDIRRLGSVKRKF